MICFASTTSIPDTSAIAAVSPLTIATNVPDVACPMLPMTGDSMYGTFRSRHCAANRSESAGPIVDVFTTIVPARAAANTPRSPPNTADTAGGSATMSTTTRAPAAASRGLSATRAPRLISALARPGVRFHAVTR